MAYHEEHHHIFFCRLLAVLGLVGVLFIAGSFNVTTQRPAAVEAVSTPGRQSATAWGFDSNDCGDCSGHVQYNNWVVTYTGEVRTEDGNLTTASTVLSTGENITLKLIQNGSWTTAGYIMDTPPALWADINAPIWHCDIYGNCFNVSSADESSINGNPGGAFTDMAIQNPGTTILGDGLSCGSFSASFLVQGVKELTANCQVTTSGPVATLRLNLSPVLIGYLQKGQFTEMGTVDAPGGTYSCNWDGGFPGCENIWWLSPVGGFVVLWGGAWYSVPSINSGPTMDGADFNWTFDVASAPISAPTLTFTGSPTSIIQGQSATLSWTSANTTSCTASDGWLGSKPLNGSESVTPLTTTTYTLACQGLPGANPSSVSKQVTINVSAPLTLSVSCLASPVTASVGQQVTWTASVSGGTGAYSYLWGGDAPLAGHAGNPVVVTYPTVGVKTGSVIVTSGSETVGPIACASSIAVSNTLPVIVLLATPSIVNIGSRATLTWSTEDTFPGTPCVASSNPVGLWSGDKAPNGSERSGPLNRTTTFNLTCSGPGGIATASKVVNVGIITEPPPQ